jgi:hypothetical protein
LISCPGPDTVSSGFNFDPLPVANPGDSESIKASLGKWADDGKS